MFDQVRQDRLEDCLIGMMAVGQLAWGVLLGLSIHAFLHIVTGN